MKIMNLLLTASLVIAGSVASFAGEKDFEKLKDEMANNAVMHGITSPLSSSIKDQIKDFGKGKANDGLPDQIYTVQAEDDRQQSQSGRDPKVIQRTKVISLGMDAGKSTAESPRGYYIRYRVENPPPPFTQPAGWIKVFITPGNSESPDFPKGKVTLRRIPIDISKADTKL